MSQAIGPAGAEQLVHDAWVGFGVLSALLFFWWEKRRRGVVDERLWVVAGCALAFGAVFSRLGTWAQHLDPRENAGLVEQFLYGNRSILGGLLGAYAGVLAGKRISGYRERTGALFAPAVALGMAVGRVGCLLTERPGTPTSLPWGVVLDPSRAAALGAPAGVPLHPSLAYEIAFHLAALVVLLWCPDRLADPADLFTWWLLGYGTFRFLVEFVRGNEVAWAGLTRPQLFLAVTVPLLAWRWYVVTRRSRIGSSRSLRVRLQAHVERGDAMAAGAASPERRVS
jgi:phosphatidylglycerol:prolipoprotein diacylglycerol transferase